MLELSKARRKPFDVVYVKVNPRNFNDVAAWTKGTIKTAGKARFIEMKTHKPNGDRQRRAFLGDYVLLAGTALKIYTPRAFAAAFDHLEGTILQPTELDHVGDDSSVVMVVDTTRADALLKEVTETSPTVVKKRTVPKPGQHITTLPAPHPGDMPGVREDGYVPPSPDQVD